MGDAPGKADRLLGTQDFRSEAFRRDAAQQERRGETRTTASTVDLERLAQQVQRRPIVEIATLIGALTYGEMIEFADGLWSLNPEGKSISKDSLPSLLHRWSTSLLSSTRAETST
jgi:hypothetical protein